MRTGHPAPIQTHMKAIQAKYLDCSGYQVNEVRTCPLTTLPTLAVLNGEAVSTLVRD